ncbi:hypothetical protein chiPu_0023561, partial [Chiloscyllium punctatum]|nr:hypothetical protein [Chiloscyllium punctatum]
LALEKAGTETKGRGRAGPRCIVGPVPGRGALWAQEARDLRHEPGAAEGAGIGEFPHRGSDTHSRWRRRENPTPEGDR